VRGGNFLKWVKKASNWAKRTGVISKGANFLASQGIAPNITGSVGKVAGTLGYGRRITVARGFGLNGRGLNGRGGCNCRRRKKK
jgi:hypothetical protein